VSLELEGRLLAKKLRTDEPKFERLRSKKRKKDE